MFLPIRMMSWHRSKDYKNPITIAYTISLAVVRAMWALTAEKSVWLSFSIGSWKFGDGHLLSSPKALFKYSQFKESEDILEIEGC